MFSIAKTLTYLFGIIIIARKVSEYVISLVRFFPIQTEYGDLHNKYLHSVQTWENTDHKKLRIRKLFTQCRDLFLSNRSLKDHPTIGSETISDNWTFFKNHGKCFLFILKALFVLEIFRFLSWLFGYVEKGLDKKAKVSFNIYDVTDWKTIITIQLLPNTSRSKSNQLIKFGQFIKYSVRNIFSPKIIQKMR